MAPMSLIARRAGLKRPTTYGVVKKLRKRGLTDCFLSKGVRLYSVMSPSALYDRYALHLQELKEALPQLVAKHEKLMFKPRVSFYEGKGELERLYTEAFQTKNELLAYLLPAQASQYFGHNWLEQVFSEYRKNSKHRCRVISVETASQTQLKLLAGIGTDIRCMKDAKVFSHEILVHDQQVLLFSFNEGFALRLTSVDAVQTQSALFEMIWKYIS